MWNKLLLLVTLCVYCKGRNVESVFRNDYQYYPEANGWFKLHSIPQTWEDGRFICSYEGAVLVSPLNNGIQAGVTKFLQDQKPSGAVFSGISTLFGPGLYRAIDGTKLEEMPIHWSKNEPSHREGCLVFSNDGSMKSQPCYERYPFLCYKEKENEEVVRNECGTVDYLYHRVEGTMICYKYHSDPINWQEAYRICDAEGGQLAVYTNYVKTKIWHDKSPEQQQFYVGYKFIRDIWWDINGDSMEPYIPGKSNSCGARNWDGKFISLNCDEYHPFLCEKDAARIV